MKLGYHINRDLRGSDKGMKVLEELGRRQVELYDTVQGVEDGTDMILSFGGDGTFLYSARTCVQKGIPILGVNCGRMGFLSDARKHAKYRISAFADES